MKSYIGNSFSLQMLSTYPCGINIEEVDGFPKEAYTASSCVGHPDTATILGVDCNRVSISLNKGDILYVA